MFFSGRRDLGWSDQMDEVRLSPSILSADFSELKRSVETVKETEWLHLDVMDGHFVPNITFGPCVIESIRDSSDHVFDTHLMISNPEKYIDEFAQAGSDIITFHIEAVDDPKIVIDKIESAGIKSGVSLKPDTDLDSIEDILDSLDLILIMTVEPGFGGQEFMDEQLLKIKRAREKIEKCGYDIDISVDGGISPRNAPRVVKSGADVLVSGSSIFKGDVKKNLKRFRQSIEGIDR